jgi:ABC-type multidrug transport system fused ATPase/permease subunit
MGSSRMRTDRLIVGSALGNLPRMAGVSVEPPKHAHPDKLRMPSRSEGGRLLSIEGLGRRFGDHRVIESLTLTVDAGERVALRGPNGSGKTTALRCVAGTVAPTRGASRGVGTGRAAFGARRLIGAALSQERSFYLRLTGHANLRCFTHRRCQSETEAVECQLPTEWRRQPARSWLRHDAVSCGSDPAGAILKQGECVPGAKLDA